MFWRLNLALGQSLPAELTMDDLVMEEHDSSQGVILEGEDWLACLFLCQGSIGFYFMYLLFFNSY